ncbi:hypothetical protein M1590_00230 [Candidatus Marsarchaeota archaeon]|nr:hypothetical protein [Candidatus Marsarchaeota archaeon]
MADITPNLIARKHHIRPSMLRVAVARARNVSVPVKRSVTVTENGRNRRLTVVRNGVGMLISHDKIFYQFEFSVNDKWRRYSVLFCGRVDDDFNPVYANGDSLLLRLDSGCETGQIAGDLTCDCRDQLEKSMKIISSNGEGMVIRIPFQEGKGTGLKNKLAAHLLENELGISNVEAAYLLSKGRDIDVRTYSGAMAVLKFLGVGGRTRIRVMTNNPRKLMIFEENGYVMERLPLRIRPNRFTYRHLKAKQDYLGHLGLI